MKKNRIVWIIMLLLSPLIIYYDNWVYFLNAMNLGTFHVVDIPLKILIASVTGFISSIPFVVIFNYVYVKKDWSEFVRLDSLNRKERLKEPERMKRLLAARFAMLPLAIVMIYSISLFAISPITYIYFIFLGTFFFWSIVLRRKYSKSGFAKI